MRSLATLLIFSVLQGHDVSSIGKKIWHNECGGAVEKLTCWNKGEPCASLGIGHFIWYPADVEQSFEEQFPALLNYLKKKGVTVPDWLQKSRHCPWATREDFYANISSQRMTELRDFLAATIDLQAQFMIDRLEATLPKLLEHCPPQRKSHIQCQWNRVHESSHGAYVLVDYCNFKGTGCNTKEQYNTQGWGLLHVLDMMSSHCTRHPDACAEFAACAEKLLEQRVCNAPQERNEQKWLPGWKKRVRTYVCS